MSFTVINEILELAIEREKEAAAFYTALSEREIFSSIKKVLAEFAAQEKKHQQLLDDFVNDKGKLDTYNFEWIPDIKRSDYIVELDYEPGMGFDEVLRVAMKREEISLKLYNDLQEKSDNADFKHLFKVLSQEEAGHKNVLERMYDEYMSTQGD